MSERDGLDVGKYENSPHSDNGIRSPVSEKKIEWSSIVGSDAWIFGVSMTVIPASRSMKGGIKLWYMDGTCRAFLMTRIPACSRHFLQKQFGEDPIGSL